MKLAFLFPGQGSQSVGMGADLYTRYPAAAHVFDQADRILTYKLSTFCFYGPEERLKETQITQPALYTTSAAALAVLQEKGIAPQAVAGHSVGEYAALLAAGSLTFETGLNLVTQRGEFMRQAAQSSPGAMAAIIGLSSGDVAALCKDAEGQSGGVVEPANFNG
ncbi:MAG TPA: acyltransferase domain-containing protein, partial [Capsulimonadaceae bacterium]|nr:acyltransferase domain-containing protein [Capsulimonadaceae bacterium]